MTGLLRTLSARQAGGRGAGNEAEELATRDLEGNTQHDPNGVVARVRYHGHMNPADLVIFLTRYVAEAVDWLAHAPWKEIAAFFGVWTTVLKILPPVRVRWKAWRDRTTLSNHLGTELYDLEELRRATTLYVEPDFQSIDPAGGEDFRSVVCARENLFRSLDRMIQEPNDFKFVFVLADSGMGKTSLLLNYYAYFLRYQASKSPLQLRLLPLNIPEVTKRIRDIPQASRTTTVLLLDAFDEDRDAIQDYRSRIEEITQSTAFFRTVVITCRSQFFAKDEEIPLETGQMRIGVIHANQPRAIRFHKLYISPFTEQQVHAYINRCFPFYQRNHRRQAQEIMRKIPDLLARPMILAHIPDLVMSNLPFKYSFEVYEQMINAWIERETGFADKQQLRRFSELLAVDMFTKRSERLQERVPSGELRLIAQSFGIKLEEWQLRGRSLLNRDAFGNYKFAHRSFMEYFVALSVFNKGLTCSEPWTDLMKVFFMEMVSAHPGENRSMWCADLSGIVLRNVTLTGIDFSGANLAKSDLRSANLTGCALRGTNLQYANLLGADLRDADMSGADLSGASMRGTKLRGAQLAGVIMTPVDLDEFDLTGADLRGFDFRQNPPADAFGTAALTTLVAAKLSDAKLCSLDLSGFDLISCNLRGADLSQANLRSADLSRSNLSNASLHGTDLRGTRLSDSHGLTQLQIDDAIGDEGTTLPRHLKYPKDWRKGVR
ncbi:MAG: pentapeptide repeat-containing protein [Bryobacterales bacterium]|nr:pentapeptide repeat-containing protein [Bryobacterales bacterium]